ncbi:hypothetical protein SAY87_024591 [Trapa incisa]|uniref:Plastid movement impaired 2 n=1 Tax=Trapa incisa TaxID=236973 RepID=A0AAN7GK39_9MYRT|nr:hypothetical protein SAY87_024591 [Trapa incisa]
MGNSIMAGRRKKVKVMKVTGETFMLKTPVHARDATAGHPGHVLLDSVSVQRLGVRARPLDPEQPLKPNKLYFLVQLPENPADTATARDPAPRRVRSGVHMSAKDRLECLMLSRRSVSELPLMRSAAASGGGGEQGVGLGQTVRMRISKAEMAELVAGSRDEAEVAQKVLRLYMMESKGHRGGDGGGIRRHNLSQWQPPAQPEVDDVAVQKRVRFHQAAIGEIVELAASV